MDLPDDDIENLDVTPFPENTNEVEDELEVTNTIDVFAENAGNLEEKSTKESDAISPGPRILGNI